MMSGNCEIKSKGLMSHTLLILEEKVCRFVLTCYFFGAEVDPSGEKQKERKRKKEGRKDIC